MLNLESYQHILIATTASLCVLGALPELTSADDVGAIPCDNGPDGLAQYGAQQTCIESPDFRGERCFYTLIPDCAGEDSPLVYDMHAFTGCPSFTVTYSGWKEKAEENCFVVVYPLGTTDPGFVDAPCWGLQGGLQLENGTASPPCCCLKDSVPVPNDDEGPFLRQVAAVLSRDVPIQTSGNVTIDTKRIYMAGHSNGCMASLYMAGQYSDMVAAVGCHAGIGVSPISEETYNPRPIAMVHGTIDTALGYNYSVLDLFSALDTYNILSNLNECTTYNETTLDNGDDYTVTLMASINCTNNASVVMYAMDNVGHFPYPGEEFASFNGPGAAAVVVDTTQWMWDFVKQYSLAESPNLVVTLTTDTPEPAPATVATPTPTDAVEDSSSARPQNDYFVVATAIFLVTMIARS
eukprot:scaffold1147_cov126-Cylindrotheca_fusiformis.AAC.11